MRRLTALIRRLGTRMSRGRRIHRYDDILKRLNADAPDLPALRAQASNPMELAYYGHDGRPASKWHHYLEIYDRHLSRFRGQPVRVLEIGVDRGGSLQIWRQYFGERAIVHGLDINPTCAAIDDPGVVVHIGSQSDGRTLNKVVDAMGGLDVVIDDGGHMSADQIETFEVLFPRLSAEGIYLCEDVHCSYWRRFGGGLRRRGSFVEYSKGLVDRLHAWYFETGRDRSDDRFPSQVRGIFFYDSMIVFEKHQKRLPFSVAAGRAA